MVDNGKLAQQNVCLNIKQHFDIDHMTKLQVLSTLNAVQFKSCFLWSCIFMLKLLKFVKNVAFEKKIRLKAFFDIM